MIYMRLKMLLQILQYKEHDILKRWSSGQVADDIKSLIEIRRKMQVGSISQRMCYLIAAYTINRIESPEINSRFREMTWALVYTDALNCRTYGTPPPFVLRSTKLPPLWGFKMLVLDL